MMNFRTNQWDRGGGVGMNPWDAEPKHGPEGHGRHTEGAASWNGQVVGWVG